MLSMFWFLSGGLRSSRLFAFFAMGFHGKTFCPALSAISSAFASVMPGVNMQDIRDLLGHSDIAVIANIYIGKSKKQSRKAVNALPVKL